MGANLRIFEAMVITVDLEQRIRRFFEDKRITVYGPHRPPSCLERLESLRDKLIEKGYQAKLVMDYPNEDDEGNPLDSRSKSLYWVEKSDHNLFIHLVDGIRNGLVIEINHMLEAKELVSKSLVAIEMTEQGEWQSSITELLREAPPWRKIKQPRFPYKEDDKLLEHILTFLQLKLYEELQG